MKLFPQCSWRPFVASLLVVSGSSVTEAGWPFRRHECCDTACDKCEKCEKAPCCFKPPVPPRAAVVDVVPARFTTQRADRVTPAPAPAFVPPPAPASASNCVGGAPGAQFDAQTAQRLSNLENDVKELKQLMEGVTAALKQN